MKNLRTFESTNSSLKEEIYAKVKSDLYVTSDKEVEEIFQCVSECIDMIADKLEENQPYAYKSIAELRNVSRTINYIEDIDDEV